MDPNPNHNTLVSIMMATYNRAAYIREAVESVLRQTYQDWELLVLDDGSTDNTAAIIFCLAQHDSRIRYLPALQNLGIASNRNRGLGYARGGLIAVLDSDDIWHDPEKLAWQVAYLRANTACVVVGTQARIIDEAGVIRGRLTYATDDHTIRARMLLRNQFAHSSVLFRAEATRALRECYPVAFSEDYGFLLRIGGLGKLANAATLSISYRVHSGSISQQKPLCRAQSYLALVRAYRRTYPYGTLALTKGYLQLIRAALLHFVIRTLKRERTTE